MARIRYLKPEFFSDEDLADLKYETRLAFAGLWCYADKSGRLEDRPKFLKAMIFPYDNVDMEKQLQLLSNKPFIQRYQDNGKFLIQIINWNKHQKPHHTEADSKIPPAPPLKEKGMGMEKQEQASAPINNREKTVDSPLKHEKKVYGEFQNVKLSDFEYSKLIERFTETGCSDRIENLSRYIASKGKKYSSHYATILSWERKNEGDSNGSGGSNVDPVEALREKVRADRAARTKTETVSD